MKPQGIIERLTDADRALQRTWAWELLLGSVKYAVALLLALFALDLIAQLPAWQRGTLTGVAVGGALLFTGYLLWRACRRRQPLERTARLLETRDTALGTKLMNVLQLEATAQNDAEHPLTRSLARQAVNDAGHAMAHRDFRPLTTSPTLKRTTKWALIVIGGIAVLTLASWPISSNEFLRYLDPLGDHPPFSFTHLSITSPGQDGLKVIYKKPIVVEAIYSGHRPSELYLSVENVAQPQNAALLPLYPEQGKKFTQQIDQVTSDLVLRAQTRSLRSVSALRHVQVILTPQLEKATLTIQPPAYTKLPATHADFTPSGGTLANLTALEGSTLIFSFRSNRPLSEGLLALQMSDADSEVKLTPGTGANETLVTGSMEAKESARCRFEIRDVTHLPNDGEWSAGLTVTHDLPPEISITEPAQDGFIVENFSAKIVFNATDDYGLRNLRLHAGVNGEFKEPQLVDCTQDPPARHIVHSLNILPKEMGASAGSVITIFGEATDIRPEPQLSRSRTLKLEVISEDQYNEFLRTRTEIRDLKNKYAAYNKELQELMKQQRELAKQAEQLAKSDKDATSKEKRDALATKQADLNNKLDALADRMNRASKEKPLYDLEKEFQKRLDEESEKIRNSIAENEGKLGDFVQKAPSQQTMEDFKQAAEEQVQRLDPMASEAQKNISETLDDAQKMQDLLKPLNKFERLYKQQKDIAEQMSAYRDKSSLSEADRLALQNFAGEEHKMSKSLQKIIDDLRDAAERAKDTYPEAAQDALNMAQQMEDATLPPLATQSAQSMLSGHGPDSYDRAEHLRDEMNKLFSEGQSKGGQKGKEFAQRLKLMRQMAAGDTFGQMGQFGKGDFKRGLRGQQGQGGQGSGFGGTSADDMQDGIQDQSLLGDETNLGHPHQETVNSSHGKAESPEAPAAERSAQDVSDRDHGANQSLRPTQSGGATTVLDEYDAVVDAYFRRLTTPKKHP